jgi:sulfur-oxidizing protein SoxZ
MTEPIRIRVTLHGDVADVRVRMSHPMETGLRKDADGKLVPIHYIRTFTARLNGNVVFEALTSQAISRNPVFGFKLKGAKTGDRLAVTWQDSRGETRTDEMVIGAA